MSNNNVKITPVSSTALKVAVTLTAIYVLVFCFVFHEQLIGFRQLELNNAGDFLAGFFAPLAFLWLVVSLWLQKNELKQNTEVLSLQLAELQNTIQHQKQIAQATTAELNVGKPFVRMDHDIINLSADSKHSKNWNLYFDLNNTGGALRQAEIRLKYHGHDLAETINELNGPYTVHFSIPSGESVNDPLTNNSPEALILVEGFDIHGEKYANKISFKIDSSKFKNIIDSTDEIEEWSPCIMTIQLFEHVEEPEQTLAAL